MFSGKETVSEESLKDASVDSNSKLSGADENDNTTAKYGAVPPETLSSEGSHIPDPGSEMANESVGEVKVKVEKLEVPSEELQCIQKQVRIEKLMAKKSVSPTRKVIIKAEPMEFEEGSGECKRQLLHEDNQTKRFRGPPSETKSTFPQPRKTFKMKSSILDRVKSFLPEFKTANDDLLRLPDPSKLSLESDSDRDEMDGNMVTVTEQVPGPSTTASATQSVKSDKKTYVEMNLALYEESGSDTSSDEDDDSILKGKVKGLPRKDASISKSIEVVEEETKVSSSQKTKNTDAKTAHSSTTQNLQNSEEGANPSVQCDAPSEDK